MKSKRITKIGCCGFGMAQKNYMQLFPTVEVQQTFYQPPQISTMKKWREAAPENFEFILKAWQLITHTSKSPTFRRLERELTASEAEDCGSFRNSAIVSEAWQTTLACAEILKATKILFQCPASFKPTDENIESFRSFFKRNRSGQPLQFFWEPRGDDWSPYLIAQLCTELKISHAVDPFVHASVTPDQLYFRLHGKNGWRYDYNKSELKELAQMVASNNTAYVLFNNSKMIENAEQFQLLITKA